MPTAHDGAPERVPPSPVSASPATPGAVHRLNACTLIAAPAASGANEALASGAAEAQRAFDWRSPAGHPVPGEQLMPADDRMTANTAYRLLADGQPLLWQGDWSSARHMLQALERRWRARHDRPGQAPADGAVTAAEAFAAHRAHQAAKAALLGRLLVPLSADHGIDLPRAPDHRSVGAEVFGPVQAPYAMSLREWLGLLSASEWRRLGVEIPALKARIHPHHGVFPPVRHEYVDLVMQAPLPEVVHGAGAFDIGTGTGVLAAALARRKLRVTATDNQPAAVACAQDNLQRLGLAKRVKVIEADLFPPGHAGLIVCNPPWVPAQPFSTLDAAVYDPDSRMLRRWLQGLGAHLSRGGEGWLILSDLAEHLGLRSRDELLGWIAAAGLQVLDRQDIAPRHPRALAAGADPVSVARRAELTSLWRLGVQGR